ncbi:MAG: DUF5615 family PIN-like protein [Oscillochloris sp.]|nr:DUF5615 family PIN-like protein [Oscillochloris sp.]
MLLRYAADENFNNDIVWGLLRRQPRLDILRIQDVGLTQADDPTVLQWAADTGRMLLTHDVKTITRYAYERVAQGLPMPGVIEVSRLIPIGAVIDDLLLLAAASTANEWDGQIVYLPLH